MKCSCGNIWYVYWFDAYVKIHINIIHDGYFFSTNRWTQAAWDHTHLRKDTDTYLFKDIVENHSREEDVTSSTQFRRKQNSGEFMDKTHNFDNDVNKRLQNTEKLLFHIRKWKLILIF